MNFGKLGVNIDHIATLRELRGTPYPDLLEVAELVKKGGAHQITIHLREDRRHIQNEDVERLITTAILPINLELSIAPAIIAFACKMKPTWACIVPEKRQELTTEGGLDLKKQKIKIKSAISLLKKRKIKVSLFIEPELQWVKASQSLGADAVEFHTGRYCLACQQDRNPRLELNKIWESVDLADRLGLGVHVGHGLDYSNVRKLAENTKIEEYNIGHSIVCRAAIVGMERAVREMKAAIEAP